MLLKHTYFVATRLRAPERLLTQLHFEEEVAEAEEAGYSFPRATSDQLQQALEALLKHDEGFVTNMEVGAEMYVEEEEEIQWEEELCEEELF